MIVLRLWVIYEHPKDYPDKFVVRGWNIEHGGVNRPDKSVLLADSLKEARELVPQGLFHLPRFKDDDPVIVETWI